jgi:UDP-glucuronate 4-epimerase
MAQQQHILLTGGTGFIGSHLTERLLQDGWKVTVVDNFDPFYDIAIKEHNLVAFSGHPAFTLVRADIRDLTALKTQLPGPYDAIVHLAAKAGVRPSIQDPVTYQEVNVTGTQNLLEFAKERGIKQFVFSSSSSVYGINPNVPWSESDYVLQPISPYASTKLSGELLGHVYSHLYGIRFIALRFFTVYGPRQRPDLAIHKFARMMLKGEPIPVFGDGATRRDYTYVGDIVQGIVGAVHYTDTPYEVVNLGNHHTVSLSEMIASLEEVLEVKAHINRLPMQPGDVPQTYADVAKAGKLWGYAPTTSFREGLTHFKKWLLQLDK